MLHDEERAELAELGLGCSRTILIEEQTLSWTSKIDYGWFSQYIGDEVGDGANNLLRHPRGGGTGGEIEKAGDYLVCHCKDLEHHHEMTGATGMILSPKVTLVCLSWALG